MKIVVRFCSFVSLLAGILVGQATFSTADILPTSDQDATASPKPESPDDGCNSLPRAKDVFRKEDGVLPPTAKHTSDPEYPWGGRGGKGQGKVLLCATVDAEGKVSEVVVVKPLAPGFDQSAIKTVRKWKFKPGSKDGKPVAVQINVVVDFHPSD